MSFYLSIFFFFLGFCGLLNFTKDITDASENNYILKLLFRILL